MHHSLSTRWVGASRAFFVFLLALSMVSLAGTPSPASPSGRDLPPKIKESDARSPGFRAPAVADVRSRVAEATRLGFCGGDDWEPEITADSFGHVYVVWPHFPGDPTCDPASANPRDVYIHVSNDGGETFGPQHIVADVPYPNVVDTVVTTNESGVVYVSFIAYGHDNRDIDVIVARSADFGATFTWTKVNGPECTVCDHPWIVASGNNVYVTYASGKNHYLSRSSDGGSTWTETNVLKAGGVAFPEGGVIDAAGNAWFAWGDCNGACSGKVAAVYRVSKTLAGTSTTTFADIASAPAGPDCPYRGACGFAYFGPQNDIAIDAAGNLYMVWQDGQDHFTPKSPPIVQLSRCRANRDCTRSSSWRYVGRADDKTSSGCAGSACYALFPRVEGAAANQIRAIWMDDRNGAPLDHKNGWNVWHRTSTTGGSSWTGPSVRVSTYDPSRAESEPHGFRFPYGDYHGIDITPGGRGVMIWGEGIDYVGGPEKPGHILYRSL
jgi:hypothetical protein